MVDTSFFGRLISDLEKKGMAQKEIAQKLGLSQPMISRIKVGEMLPGNDRLRMLSDLIDNKYSATQLMAMKTAIRVQKNARMDFEKIVDLVRSVK